jgi:hypothetical protein
VVRLILRALLGLALGIVALVCFVFFSPRPALTIDPAVLAGDGSLVDYCDLPVLDGSGKRASDIPKGNTPGCGYDHFPLPVLADCTEPLPPEAGDLRGLWIGVEGGHIGHVERVEQCGRRVVVTAAGIIHDMGPNSTGGETSNDTEGGVVFTIGGREFCTRTSAGIEWEDGTLNFHALGFGPLVVRRYRDGEQLVWEYADGSTTRMDRLCRLPAEHRKPEPRGPRWRIF